MRVFGNRFFPLNMARLERDGPLAMLCLTTQAFGEVFCRQRIFSTRIFDLVLARKIRSYFLLDSWVGEMPLTTRFFDLYRWCAQHKSALVEDYMDGGGEYVLWGPNFRRNLKEIVELPIKDKNSGCGGRA